MSCEKPNEGMKGTVNFDVGKTHVLLDLVDNSICLVAKTDRSLLDEKSSCTMLGLSVNSRFNLVFSSNVVFNAKTGS